MKIMTDMFRVWWTSVAYIHLINVRVATVPRGLLYFNLLSENIHPFNISVSHNTLTAEAFKRAIADNYCLGKE